MNTLLKIENISKYASWVWLMLLGILTTPVPVRCPPICPPDLTCVPPCINITSILDILGYPDPVVAVLGIVSLTLGLSGLTTIVWAARMRRSIVKTAESPI